ncbi:hypothetical protein R70723_04130 [Paenibacillus sp. FSL R7-0273]|uniref:hypothetical protein n=1 Tax=Paenibacillus sp. FSL R7-0273 TaxID=1536772 RepID=UPI0004F6653B|nr:hypothetical protein [Paenibacillus sp. FSL R7-0273]AIQ45173.1 hypothetical protein R70723_04130 [Paenibacillus sp. FSL R7-0273]OMF85691.1 hypothetical protein BK144_27395 [Paenibacillus sp. FSL R7-0273]
MLTFEQKLAIFDSYPELERRDVSLGRVNYHFEESRHDKKTVASHLHPNGNGFVYAGLLRGYETDGKGLVNIRDYSEADLRELISASISSLSMYIPDAPAPSKRKKKAAASAGAETLWTNADGNTLSLKFEEDLWYLYAGLQLEMAFETIEEAEEYLAEEGFRPAGN